MLEEVKHYLRVDEEYDDELIETLISSSEEYLINAGITEKAKSTALYKLCIKMICKNIYDEKEDILDKSILTIIRQMVYLGDL